LTSHHELCFACGLANLFGLQMELSRDGERVTGRFFAKQDHQGADGTVHRGVLFAALEDAMQLAGGHAGAVEFLAPVPIGTFVEVSASGSQGELRADGQVVAMAKLAEPG
jgi:acyl-coenzyme A thioesterase PaaI-like protein